MSRIETRMKEYLVEKDYKGSKRDWTYLWKLNADAVEKLKYRKEKWIKKIIRLSKVKEDPMDLSKKGLIYILCNVSTRRVYIGETAANLLERWRRHFYDSRHDKKRSSYRYLNKLGFHKWMILPLEYVENEKHLKYCERGWMNMFKHEMINDPVTWSQKPTKRDRIEEKKKNYLCKKQKSKGGLKPIRPYMKPKKLLDEIQKKKREVRFTERKLRALYCRNYVLIILKTELWRKWSIETLMEICNNMRGARIPNWMYADVTRRVRCFAFNKLGLRIKEEYNCFVGYTNRLNAKQILTDKLKMMLRKGSLPKYGHQQARWIRERTNIVMRTYKTISDMFNNSRTILRLNDDKCECKYHGYKEHINWKVHQIPAEWKDLREVMEIHKKTPLVFKTREYIGMQFDAFNTFAKLTGVLKINTEENDDLYKTIKSTTPTKVNVQHTYQEIRKIRDKYNFLAFVELDKNANSWNIMCKKRYIDSCNDHFNNEKIYKRVTEPELEIVNRWSKELGKLTHIASIFKGGEISSARLLPKNKDTEKFRPLISFSKVPARNIGKLMGRGLTVIVKEIGKIWNNFNLMHAKDGKKIILKHNKNENRNEGSTMILFDVKNQFTNLPKKEMYGVLVQAIREIILDKGLETVRLHRRQIERKKDKLGGGKSRDFKMIPLTDILYYTKVEMDYTYFKLGNNIYSQIDGLPMGGFMSASLAMIYSMYMENKKTKLWKSPNENQLWIRFRDDILLIIKKRISENDVQEIFKNMRYFYTKELELELEEWNYNQVNFLDMTVWQKNGVVNTSHYNKNVSLLGVKTKEIKRLPEIDSVYPKVIKTGVITGLLKTAMRVSSTETLKRVSVMQIVIELKIKNYPWKWIKDCLLKIVELDERTKWRNFAKIAYFNRNDTTTWLNPETDDITSNTCFLALSETLKLRENFRFRRRVLETRPGDC